MSDDARPAETDEARRARVLAEARAPLDRWLAAQAHPAQPSGHDPVFDAAVATLEARVRDDAAERIDAVYRNAIARARQAKNRILIGNVAQRQELVLASAMAVTLRKLGRQVRGLPEEPGMAAEAAIARELDGADGGIARV